MPCRTTQDRQVLVEISDKKWSTGEGNGKPLQYSCHRFLISSASVRSAAGLGSLGVAVCAWDLLKEVTIIFITSTIVWSQVKKRREHRPCPSIENWITDLLGMAHPSEQDPVSPSVNFSHQKVSISLLSISFSGQTERKPQSQKTNQTDHMDHSSIQFTQSCPALCNPMDCSTPGFPVHYQFLEFAQTYVHRVSNAIQPSHLLSSPSPPTTFNLLQHQGLFQ